MNRLSILPTTQYCAGAGVLGAKHGAGRAAAMSKAFHALCSGVEEESARLYAQLTQQEQKELLSWHQPRDVEVGDVVLRWREGVREAEVSIEGAVGHPDCYWIVEINGEKIAYVADIKKSDWTSPDGVESLQLHAYGLAVAEASNCDGYCCGIWNATLGEWDWGPLRYLVDADTFKIRARVLAAASNVGEDFSTGSHCSSCYQRWYCPEHMLPVADPESALAPLAELGELSPEQAKAVLFTYQAAKDLLEKVKGALQDYADQNGGIRDGEGKIWRRLKAGKPSEIFDKKRFAEENPELYDRYVRIGEPRNLGHRWVNES